MKIRMDKIIRSMSIALDLSHVSSFDNSLLIEDVTNIDYGKNKFIHHSQRATYIALEIAKTLNLDEESLKELYVSSLLHDIGAINYINESHSTATFIHGHCIAGAEITKPFPYFENMSKIILYHHENFDGSGAMDLSFDQIPLESQIIRLADLVEVLYDEKIPCYKQKDIILRWVKNNSNKIISPKLTEIFSILASKDIFWFNIQNIHSMDFILESLAPKIDISLDLHEFEVIAQIFSKIIDNKSKFTAMHSIGISELAYKVSKNIGYDKEKCLKMKIAGLLHDIGKLAIPTNILDKPGSLTHEEFDIIKSHVYYTKIILDRIDELNDISEWASNHHEKLTGTGYPRRLDEASITEEARILGTCDIYQALTEDRPYRKGLDCHKAFSIMNGMASEGLICTNSLQLLKATINYED